MRTRIIGALSAALALAVSVIALPQAEASGCVSPHCYGVTRWPVTHIYGIEEDLESYLLHSTDTSTFVTSEMWLATDNSDGGYWVEEGQASGYPTGSASPFYYWADNRPGLGYSEHDLSIAFDLNTAYHDYILYVGNNSWAVHLSNTVLGTSTNNPGPANWASAGSETNGSSNQVSAYAYAMQFEDVNSVWHTTGWNAPPIASPVLYANAPESISWDPAYTGIFYDANEPTSTVKPVSDVAATSGPVTASAATAIAKKLASSNGGTASSTVSLTSASHASAVTDLAMGSTSQNVADPVYAMQISGNFRGFSAKIPPGQPFPTGNTLTVIVDRNTGRITDWSITNTHKSLAVLGKVTEFK